MGATRARDGPNPIVLGVLYVSYETNRSSLDRESNISRSFRTAQGGSNGVKKCDMEDPNVGESIIGFKMDINNMQCYHIE